MSGPERPVLRWHGGKWKLARWILGYFPPHRTYVEPFGGACSVLLRKERSYAEVYNDLDDEVVGLFRVLQDARSAQRLRDLLVLTPFARREFEIDWEKTSDHVESARRLIIRAYMGFGSNAHNAKGRTHQHTGFRANSDRSGTLPAHDLANYLSALDAIVVRMRGVIIECRDAVQVMRQHDSETTLHYVDPPYMPETRSPSGKKNGKFRMYAHEMSDAEHVTLLAALRDLSGMVVLSGYPHPLYNGHLPHWRRVECRALADGARERTEVLWINPKAVAELDAAGQQLSLLTA